MTNNTIRTTVTATDGTELTIRIPAEPLPSQDRGARLRALYNEHVKPVKPGDSWKAACYAEVEPQLADDVAEAMGFMGSIVDKPRCVLASGLVRLESAGYWAHGF